MKYLLLIFTLISSNALANKSQVSVALEVFPPLVTQQGEGLVVNLLKAIEGVSDYSFNVSIMTYARCKRELQGERVQLIGLTPKNNETTEFYQFAKELSWELPVSVDLFVNNLSDIPKYKNILVGVPTGNADFFSELLDIPRENFVEVSHLKQLTQMLSLGRIDGIIFERVAVVETFKETGYESVYYHQLTTTAASLAVSNTAKGTLLKNKLDSYINTIAQEKIFAQYNSYLNLPATGNITNILEKME